MTLAVGNKIGFYEIVVQIGAGGMGEVYRAHDTKLNRDVALKVLPSEFANDPERMGRFKREAQLLASLNHTNIAAIYGLEESGGVRALIMELAEGPTLAERILKGPIPLDEALAIARQIAEALEAAHEKGIIHRDLKPANIKITPEGAVKVLDFGLAKALEGEAAIADASESPTISLAATKAGVILGTAAYMAPEQARGSGVDKRCDIWSFGVVLFEMLTGKQLFAGETVSDTLAAVLRADVDWNLLPANTPPSIRTLLRRCLTKDRKQRLQAIGDARIAIEEYTANPSGASAQETVAISGGHKFRHRLAWGIVTLLVAALTVLGVIHFREVPEPRQVTRFEYTLPEDQQFRNFAGDPFLAISPDGRQFAYTTNKGLYIRSLGEWTTTLLVEGDENPSNPFFSHDGKWVGYRSVAENKLKKVSVKGGEAPRDLRDVRAFSGAFWTADDAIIYGEYGTATLVRVYANGGNPKVLFKGDAAYYYHPQLLADEKSLLFTLSPYPYRIAAGSLGSPESKTIIPQGARAFYLPTGHIVYGLGNKLYAVSFDPSKLMTAGDRVPVVEGIFRTSVDAAPQYDVSPSGTLIYAQGTTTKQTLVWVNRAGKAEPLNVPLNEYDNLSSPRISPDGTRVALTVRTAGNADIRIWDLIRNNMAVRLTDDEAEDRFPLWTRDSKQVVYSSSRDGAHYDINRKPADGSGKVVTLGSPPNYQAPLSWSKDEKTLLSWEGNYSSQTDDIVTFSLEDGFKRTPLLNNAKYGESYPQISPNGRWLAYASTEEGQDEVYVVPFPEVTKQGKSKVSIDGGYGALWSPDGREIFYRNGDFVMAVAVETEPVFKITGRPQKLFSGKYFSGSGLQSKFPIWDVHPDGKRFLMVKETESTASATGGPRKINIVVNWFEDLKKLVPVK
jgi:eukaryotic-like serine/threonine-protein kinase